MQATASSPLRAVRPFFLLLIGRLRRSLKLISKARHKQEEEKEFVWVEAYKAALMEFNEQRLSATIEAAMRAIEQRKQALGSSRKSIREWNLLERAALTLWSIRAGRSSPLSQTEPRPRVAANQKDPKAIL
jgi:hypothetical protein